MDRKSVVAGIVALLAVCGLLKAESADVVLAGADRAQSVPVVEQPAQPTLGRVAEEFPDPLAFFQKLVDRYRKLTSYRDTAQIVEITERQGEEPKRVEKQIACEIEDGELQITTPARQILRRLGLILPIRPGPAMEAAKRDYDRWLAPHMTMKYTAEPLHDFRPGVEQGFTATEVGPVTIDRKDMVHLKLKSGDGRQEGCDAIFDLFVDPESMLIERIEGEQRLSDGASYQTTIDIDPESEAISESDKLGMAPPVTDSPPKELPLNVVPPGTAPPRSAPPGDTPPAASPPGSDGPPPADAQREGADRTEASQPPPATDPASSAPVTSPPPRPDKPEKAPPATPPASDRGTDRSTGSKTDTPPKSSGHTTGGGPVDMFRLR